MIYNQKEFLYIRPRNSQLQIFKPTNYTADSREKAATGLARKNSAQNVLKTYLQEYCRTSPIHGFHYFSSNELKRFERFFWSFTVLILGVCCTIVYCKMAELYYSNRVQTTVDDSVYPVFLLPFPSVGICLRRGIDWQRLHYQAPKHFLPPNVNNETLHSFRKFFETLGHVKFHNLKRLAPLFDAAAKINLTLLDEVNVLDVLEYLSLPCSQVFDSLCTWRFRTFNCCELMVLERTEIGFCYTFNSVVSERAQKMAEEDAFYPYHNSYSGEGSGLQVSVVLDETKLKPGERILNGVYMMIKNNDEWHADVKFVNQNTFAKLSIVGQLWETDAIVKHISPCTRNCLFEDDTSYFWFRSIPGLTYGFGNCRTRCHQEYALKYCRCNLDLFFPIRKSDNFTSCKPSDFQCLYEHAQVFSRETHHVESQYVDVENESMSCHCLNSCNQYKYEVHYSSFPLEGLNSSDGIKKIYLDIHYNSGNILKYHTAMSYTFAELIANFGGIVGLFLGASVLSAVELILHLSLSFYMCARHQLRSRCNKCADVKLVKRSPGI